MRISIITVCLNSANTLARCLRSVAAQGYPEIEHIVIDGNSEDGTQDIIRTHADHVAFWSSEPDKGVYDAMNKGLAHATGDIVCILNADDFYADDGVLARVARHFEDDNLDAVLADVAFFREDQPGKLVRRYRSNHFTPERVAWGWMPAHPGIFARRKVYERFGVYRTDYRIAGDYEWIARCFKPGQLRYAHLPEVVIHMQMGGISTGGWRSTLLLNQEVLRACRENGIDSNWFKLLSKYPMKLVEFLRP